MPHSLLLNQKIELCHRPCSSVDPEWHLQTSDVLPGQNSCFLCGTKGHNCLFIKTAMRKIVITFLCVTLGGFSPNLTIRQAGSENMLSLQVTAGVSSHRELKKKKSSTTKVVGHLWVSHHKVGADGCTHTNLILQLLLNWSWLEKNKPGCG